MASNNEVSISAVFTEEMIEASKKCKDREEIQKKVIEPNMARINEATGQENDPRYWAYAMEFTLSQLARMKIK